MLRSVCRATIAEVFVKRTDMDGFPFVDRISGHTGLSPVWRDGIMPLGWPLRHASDRTAPEHPTCHGVNLAGEVYEFVTGA